MKYEIRWSDIPHTVAAISPLPPAGAECGIAFQGHEIVSVLLLSEGMFALLCHRRSRDPNDQVALALGRVLADHVVRDDRPCYRRALLCDLRRSGLAPSAGDSLASPDLAGVTTAEVRGDHVSIYHIQSDNETALLFVARSQIGVRGWAQFSKRLPSRSLLIGLGRLVVAYHNAAED